MISYSLYALRLTEQQKKNTKFLFPQFACSNYSLNWKMAMRALQMYTMCIQWQL